MKSLCLLTFLIVTLNSPISNAQPGFDKIKNVYNNKNSGFDKATLGSDCYQGMRAGARMGKSPLGKAALGFGGMAAAAGKNYMQNTAGNTIMDRCKTMFKGPPGK